MSQPDEPVQDPPPVQCAWSVWLAIGGIALSIFAAVTWLMFASETLNELDRRLAVACQQHAAGHEGLVVFFRAYLTNLGGTAFMTIVGTVGTLLMAARRQWLLAAIWALAAGGGAWLNYEVKEVIDRQRPGPELRDPRLRVRHDSFPSGHAMGATIGYGMCLYASFHYIRRRRTRMMLAVAALVLVNVIGVSRVYLRAHWFSDILGGYALGTAWLCFTIAVGTWFAEWHGQRSPPAPSPSAGGPPMG